MRTVAHARSERGEVHLCQREDGTLELRVNGVFVMDSTETRTERLLADVSLSALPEAGATVLVAGLGLGFTLAAVLDNPAIGEAHVVEIEPDLVQWHRTGAIPPPSVYGPGGAAQDQADRPSILADPRVRVEVADVREAVTRLPVGEVDAILLDVDNGPGHLVYDGNAAVYEASFLQACASVLRPAGVVAVWSASPSRHLLAAMGAVFARVEESAVPVRLGQRPTTYHVFVGHVEG
jgi:spermidine synthase